MLFDPKSFETSIEVVETYEGDYPKRLLLPTQEREIEVTPGGIVITANIRDAFLLAHDGITQVEFQPELTDEYMRAAENPDQEMVDFAAAAHYFASDFIGTTHFPKKSIEELLIQKFGEQVVRAPKLSPIAKNFSEHLLFVRSWLQAFNHYKSNEHEYRFDGLQHVQKAGFFHMDGSYEGRALFNIAGKQTLTVDSRVTAMEAEALMDKECREEVSSNMSKYSIRKTTLGSITFICGSGVLTSDCLWEAIRNLSVHSGPQDYIQGEDARLFIDMS